MTGFDVQADGLVGPTHNYAGLSHGNVASATHAQSVSYPKKAALQGIAKMRFVASLGMRQLVVPPPPRPNFELLRRLGFTGSDAAMLDAAHRASPQLLYQAYSAASMWTANLATVTASANAADGRLHFTPANLATTAHRAQEAAFAYPLLQAMFGRAGEIHEPLPASLATTDEGAANHMRFAGPEGRHGVEVMVYGRVAGDRHAPAPLRYPARQTREACEALARLHVLPPEACVLVQQHPAAIDAGVFHNDVIAMSEGSLLVYHEHAFQDEEGFLAELRAKLAPAPLVAIRVTDAELPLSVAVESYLFNSQLLTLPGGGIAIVAPAECEAVTPARRILERLRDEGAVRAVHYLDVRESMKNGGGPACLRLRVPMDEPGWGRVDPSFMLTDALAGHLEAWVGTHYRDRLSPDDLRDPAFAREALEAREALIHLIPALVF